LSLELHEKPLSAVAFQHRGPILASASPDGKIALWHPGESSEALAVEEIGDGVTQLKWSPGDGRLAIGGESGTVAVFAV
jgi:WD40 repeat protein